MPLKVSAHGHMVLDVKCLTLSFNAKASHTYYTCRHMSITCYVLHDLEFDKQMNITEAKINAYLLNLALSLLKQLKIQN